VADQDDTIRDLAKLLIAALAGRHDAIDYADRIKSTLGIGEDDDAATVEAGLSKALGEARAGAVASLDREQLGTALSALEDAADYRREHEDGFCADCGNLPEGGLCGDHAADETVASMYDLLHDELQEHQGHEAEAGSDA
jgi:hypothetical protein